MRERVCLNWCLLFFQIHYYLLVKFDTYIMVRGGIYIVSVVYCTSLHDFFIFLLWQPRMVRCLANMNIYSTQFFGILSSRNTESWVEMDVKEVAIVNVIWT